MAKLTVEIVRREYLVNKLTSYEIAAKYHCSAAWVNTFRKRHGIRTLKPWERNELQALSQRQTEYVYGALLGDDGLKKHHPTGNAYLSVSHSKSQAEYVKFKYEIMSGFVRSGIKVYHDKRPDRQDTVGFRTICHPVFTKLYEEIYPLGRKTICREWLERLTPFSLAIWYMDDGSLTQSNGQMRISTEAFSYQEQRLLQAFLAEKWGIRPHIKPSQAAKKWVLYFDAIERDKLFALISPYVIDCMRYKLR
jgi:hypothetical protein